MAAIEELTEPSAQVRANESASVEVSVVMPCLNEAETIGICVRKANEWLACNAVQGEVLVVVTTEALQP